MGTAAMGIDMAETATRAEFEERAFDDPYSGMEERDHEYVAEEMEIIPVDAENTDGIDVDMSWGQRYIGGGGPLTVTDYGEHRKKCDDLGEFKEFIREKLKDSFPSQYLKVMDDDKEQIADTLIAVTKRDGYVVLPYFEDE